MQRRALLKLFSGGLTALAALPLIKASNALALDKFSVLSIADTEWKKRLTPAQYNILREEGTERPYTSPLLEEHRNGTFACVACDLPLFLSNTKFDSGTGWPSFFDGIQGHFGTKEDRSLFSVRTEYHCARCGGHHGHVFEDGPAPTGLRYCNNGVALKFIPKDNG